MEGGVEQVTQEETVEPSEVAVEHIKNLQHPVTHRTKKEIKDDIVPQEVLESTMEVENGYFERFIVKRKFCEVISVLAKTMYYFVNFFFIIFQR